MGTVEEYLLGTGNPVKQKKVVLYKLYCKLLFNIVTQWAV